MRKTILLVVLAFLIMSSTQEYGDYVVISNDSYRAQSVTIYYDYDDGYWTPIEQMHIPGQYSTTFHADTSMLYKYAYKSSNMVQIEQVYSKHIRIR